MMNAGWETHSQRERTRRAKVPPPSSLPKCGRAPSKDEPPSAEKAAQVWREEPYAGHTDRTWAAGVAIRATPPLVVRSPAKRIAAAALPHGNQAPPTQPSAFNALPHPSCSPAATVSGGTLKEQTTPEANVRDLASRPKLIFRLVDGRRLKARAAPSPRKTFASSVSGGLLMRRGLSGGAAHATAHLPFGDARPRQKACVKRRGASPNWSRRTRTGRGLLHAARRCAWIARPCPRPVA
jgi:hypothetical protein